MTTTYDPHHPAYLDEADVRNEMARVSQVCHGCRQCVDLCGWFPTLFELIDRFDDVDAGRMTPAEQDRVVDECFHCGRCAHDCPYTPDRHEAAVDVPRLVLRVEAMRHTNGHRSFGERVTDQVVARTDLVGAFASAVPTLANAITTARPGSLVRRVLAASTGVSSHRRLPPFAPQRFSTWMRKRTSEQRDELGAARRGQVTVFPTCLVEYHDVQVGRDLVRVYERNGIACTVTAAGCCGAPWLHAGDVERFVAVATENVRTLVGELRDRDGDIVVPDPTCAAVLVRDYPAYCDPARRADAELVARRVVDASEHLVRIHRVDPARLDTDFSGDVPERIVYHSPSRPRTQPADVTSSDLLALTGADVAVVDDASGVDGRWGWRRGRERVALPVAERLAERIRLAGGGEPGTVVAGDCTLANTAIAEQTGSTPIHPISVVARAYGIPPG